MNGCMETGKPLISILMAVYEPRMDWLREQLLSLNAQTYPNLRLYICDDCSPTVSYEEIQSCVQDCISAFPYSIERNAQNLGSNGTFERLTREAEGVFFAYCDQDDVWLPEKLAILQETIERERAELVCSDMYIINSEGKQVADSITKVRRRHKFSSGSNLSKKLVFHNWVTGCTMIVHAKTAKELVPFCPYMIHDQYIALMCAEKGKIFCVTDPLIRYRIHGGNQTGVLIKVNNKFDYLQIRILDMRKRLEWLMSEDKVYSPELQETLTNGLEWVRAREVWMKERRGGKVMWEFRKYGPRSVLLEFVAPLLSEKAFMKIINLAQRNFL